MKGQGHKPVMPGLLAMELDEAVNWGQVNVEGELLGARAGVRRVGLTRGTGDLLVSVGDFIRRPVWWVWGWSGEGSSCRSSRDPKPENKTLSSMDHPFSCTLKHSWLIGNWLLLLATLQVLRWLSCSLSGVSKILKELSIVKAELIIALASFFENLSKLSQFWLPEQIN